MTTKILAQVRLTLSNDKVLIRDLDKNVKVIAEDGAVVALFPKKDWQALAEYFTEMSSPDVML